MTLEIRTKGSLCSGTGALDAATPGELQWVSEMNEDANTVLKREHPGVPNFGDLTICDWNYQQHHVDLLTSGDPCQSMSAAGRQMASADERFLWPHVMDVIRKIRPNEIFLENVQNLVSVPLIKGGERGGVLKMRLDDLREAGYAARWTVLGACAVGAPHHRHRWFLRARYVGANAPIAERVINKCGAPRSGGRILLPTPVSSDADGGGADPTRERRRAPNLRDVVNTLLPTPVARDADGRGEGDAEFWARREQYRANGKPLGATVALLPTPGEQDGIRGGMVGPEGARDRRAQGHALNLEDAISGYVLEAQDWGKFTPAVRLWEEITGREAPKPTDIGPRGGPRLSAELPEWMMGLRAGHVTKGMDRRAALRLAGNGVVVRQARAAWDML